MYLLAILSKKGGKHDKPQSMASKFFKGMGFCVVREGPEI